MIIEISGRKIDKDSDIIVVKIDTQYCNISTARDLFENIKKQLPQEYPIIGIPTGIDLEIKDIDFLINELLKLKENNNEC